MNKTDKKILHLTLKKKWFDLIASGEKKEEYREIKPYWASRLTTLPPGYAKMCSINDCEEYTTDFDFVKFRNRYSKDAPTITVECKQVYIDEGKPEWGAEAGKQYFVIKLGDIIK